jgi:hypothetical protein
MMESNEQTALRFGPINKGVEKSYASYQQS